MLLFHRGISAYKGAALLAPANLLLMVLDSGAVGVVPLAVNLVCLALVGVKGVLAADIKILSRQEQAAATRMPQ